MSPLTPKLFLSGILGLIYGLMSYFFLMDLPDAGRWALICGLFAFAVTLLILLINDSRMTRRYEKAEKQLPCEPEFRVGANLREERRVASVNLYMCDGEMCLLNVHKKEPVLIRIRREDVRAARLDSPIQLDLTLVDGRALSLLTPYMEELAYQLRRHGWLITEHHE